MRLTLDLSLILDSGHEHEAAAQCLGRMNSHQWAILTAFAGEVVRLQESAAQGTTVMVVPVSEAAAVAVLREASKAG